MELYYLLILFWFVFVAESILFFVYLWQLKEYHIGRFLAHFSTERGKRLIYNPVTVLKIFLLFAFVFKPLWIFLAIIVIYALEGIKAIFDLITKRFKRPVLTKKAIFLILANIFLQLLFIFIIYRNLWYFERFVVFWNAKHIMILAFWLLIFDIFIPLIVSSVVLLFQPLAVLARYRIIRKAKRKREQFKNLLVIGITGSYGKTSTKEFLYSVLFHKLGSKVLKTKEHQNSEIGISQCILNDLKAEHQVFIVEMGAYNRGGIKLLCDIAQPKWGILTGINEQHMATFGSQENIIKAKYELIESLPKDGIAFFNAKNKYCLELYNKTSGIKKISYGQEATFFGGENILGAVAIAKEAGMADGEIKEAVDKINNKMPGIKILPGINGLKIIDATYSANPDGVIANLEYLKQFTGKKVLVMPCLIELGKASKEVHARIGKKIAEVCDLAIITTGDRFKEIKKNAGGKAVLIENPKKIFKKIKSFAKEGDVILLESRVPKNLVSLLIK